MPLTSEVNTYGNAEVEATKIAQAVGREAAFSLMRRMLEKYLKG